jgi:hypothetical protein
MDSASLTPLPKPVRIGPHQWRFVWVTPTPAAPVETAQFAADPAPRATADEDAWGWCSYGDHMIQLHPELARRPSLFAEVLWHEVGHAINHIYGVKDGQDEEEFTTQSARGWLQVFRDNRHFFTYIGRLTRSAS